MFLKRKRISHGTLISELITNQLSKETGEQVDWERYERLTKEQGAYVPEKKENLAWDADL